MRGSELRRLVAAANCAVRLHPPAGRVDSRKPASESYSSPEPSQGRSPPGRRRRESVGLGSSPPADFWRDGPSGHTTASSAGPGHAQDGQATTRSSLSFNPPVWPLPDRGEGSADASRALEHTMTPFANFPSLPLAVSFNPNANSFNPNAGSFVPGGAPAFVPGQPYGGGAPYPPQGGPPPQGNPADYYNQYAGAYGAGAPPYGEPTGLGGLRI